MEQADLEHDLLQTLADILDESPLHNASKVGVLEVLKHALIQAAVSGEKGEE